jgi:6-phosphogluconolactonase/glucosamine-6-phosphate isomerase/deaminase
VQVERLGSGKPGEVSIIFPSTAPDKETNQTAFGSFIATMISDRVTTAQRLGKIPVLDLPTGSTPRAVWPELSKKISSGELNLSGAVFVGHEIAFGAPDTDGPVDYERSRRKILEGTLGVKLHDITDPRQIGNGEIQGNYVAMNAHQGTDIADSAQRSADLYDQMLHALRARDDVAFIGVYGVGKDGHVAEIQTNTLTGAADYDTQHAYSYPITWNSDIRGAVKVPGDTKREFHNNMWKPGDEPNYHGGTHLVGPGWEDLLFHEDMILAFNDSGKKVAFASTIEGSVDAIVTNDTGESVMETIKDHGKGENIYSQLLEYAQTLVGEGLLMQDAVDGVDASDKPRKSKRLFKEMYASLYEKKDELGVELSHEVFDNLWNFANEYLGKQTPVSVLVRLRTLLGLNTTIVATPEVVRNTKYEELAPMGN